MANEALRIQVSETGSRTVSRNIEHIGGSAGKAAVQANRLRNALLGLSVASGALQLAKMLDTFTNLQNRIRNVTTSTTQMNVVTEELFAIANRTRSSFESTAEVYTRTALSVKDLGLSQRETLEFTERLNKTIILSGASAAEAQGAMIQLSQGLASGTLRGDELRSVLEQLPAVADVIAKGLGVTRGELRKLGQEGKISALDVINAYKKFGAEIDANFSKTIPTMGQALQVVQNRFLQVVSSIDQSLKITENIARAFLALSAHMDTIVRVGGVLVAIIGLNLVPVLLRLAAALILPIFTGNPFLMMIGGAFAAIAALVAFGDKMKFAGDQVATVRDALGVVWDRIVSGATVAFEKVKEVATGIAKQVLAFFGQTEVSWDKTVRGFVRSLVLVYASFLATYDTIVAKWKIFPQAFAETVWDAVKRAYELIIEFGSRVLKWLGEFVKSLIAMDFSKVADGWTREWGKAGDEVGQSWTQSLNKHLEEGTKYVDGIRQEAHQRALTRIQEETKAEAEKAKAIADLNIKGENKTKPNQEDENRKKTFADYLKELQRERELGLATGDALRILNEQRQIANKLRRDLTETENAAVAKEVEAIAALERRRTLLEEINQPQRDYSLGVQDLTFLYENGHITLDQYNQQFTKLRENFLNGLPEATTFADGFAIQMEKMKLATQNGFGQMGTEVAKIFGPGGTLINGIGDAIAQSIVFGKSFKEQIRGIAQSILSQLISSLVKMGLNMVLNAALGNSLMAASTASGVAQGAALTAAYAPAAAMSSLATGGANAAGASTGISTIFSLLASLGGSLFGSFGKGFSEGGFTGAIGTNDIAGVVHGQEFVINAAATKRHRSLLEALNSGKDPVAPILSAATPQPVNVSITNEIPDANFEVRPLGEAEIEIIAKRVVRREATEVIANDLRNPNSRTSKSMSASTYAGRRR